MIRVFLVDDHAIVREGLKGILAADPEIVVAGEAGDGREAMLKLKGAQAGVLILDLSLPGRGGLETLRDAHERYPHLRVLVLSMHPEDQYALRVVREGANGYLNKESAPTELVAAVRHIAAGGTWLSDAVKERLVDVFSAGPEGARHESLTSREFEILRRLAGGKTVSEVAAELILSVKTISTYRSRILVKLGLETTADLVRYAMENQLLE